MPVKHKVQFFGRGQRCYRPGTRLMHEWWEKIFHSWGKLRWTPSSKQWLIRLDETLRKLIIHQHEGKFVSVEHDGKSHAIWTVVVKGDNKENVIPIVLVHGMGGGSNMFLKNIDSLAGQRDVYLLDLPGYGLSCRPDFEWNTSQDGSGRRVPMNGEEVQAFYVALLEEWFKAMGLDRVILLGHSLGAFFCSLYTMTHQHRVQHLILAEPWGFPPRPIKFVYPSLVSRVVMTIMCTLYNHVNMFTPLRALGPLGPTVFWYVRSDLRKRYALDSNAEITFFNYFYACNSAGLPSGELAFGKISVPFAYALKPLQTRVTQWASDMGITFIFGGMSWADSRSGFNTKAVRAGSYVDVQIIEGAGHHVHTDRPNTFNHIVNLVGQALDKGVTPNLQDHESPDEADSAPVIKQGISLVSKFLIYNREHDKDS